MNRAAPAPNSASADASPRMAMGKLLRGLMAVGFGLARASGDYVRGLLDAGAKVSEAPPFDLEAMLRMLARAVGWANALRLRLEAEGVALAVQTGTQVAAAPAREQEEAQAVGARGPARPATRVHWQPCEEPEWSAQIAGLSTEQVVAQICTDMTGVAGVMGAGWAARRVGRYWEAAKALLGQVPKALARPAFVVLAPADDVAADGCADAAIGPLRPG